MSTIEISRANFEHNLNQIAQKTQSLEKVALVLKDNAYGHGLELVASLAARAGVSHAVVRNLPEAEKVAPLFKTVLVLADIPEETPPEGVRFVVNDLRQIGQIPRGTAVELKVDTGMHRNGIAFEEAECAVEAIEKRGLRLMGVMTHYRGADEMGSDFFWQRKRFETLRDRLEKEGLKGVRWHSCNSAALFRSERFEEDIARVGIAAYGCLRMPEPFGRPDLRPVMSLWADRLSTRPAEPSWRIGYGGEGRLEEGGHLSTYDIGYGDGWLRGDASKPYRLPDGRPLVGRVSMDMVSVAGEEERICLFRDAAEAAVQFGTIAYDVMVKLSPRIPRVAV
ncbi:alanine racemase [Hydrogenimonas sp. SS33]|uniref:alanine racemase n=1 Tax=Hydrogenimonas leucolamina TaxID=2954236 RepID=UPI00336C14E3